MSDDRSSHPATPAPASRGRGASSGAASASRILALADRLTSRRALDAAGARHELDDHVGGLALAVEHLEHAARADAMRAADRFEHYASLLTHALRRARLETPDGIGRRDAESWHVRALVAEIALATSTSETAVSTLLGRAKDLVERFPTTF